MTCHRSCACRFYRWRNLIRTRNVTILKVETNTWSPCVVNTFKFLARGALGQADILVDRNVTRKQKNVRNPVVSRSSKGSYSAANQNWECNTWLVSVRLRFENVQQTCTKKIIVALFTLTNDCTSINNINNILFLRSNYRIPRYCSWFNSASIF